MTPPNTACVIAAESEERRICGAGQRRRPHRENLRIRLTRPLTRKTRDRTHSPVSYRCSASPSALGEAEATVLDEPWPRQPAVPNLITSGGPKAVPSHICRARRPSSLVQLAHCESAGSGKISAMAISHCGRFRAMPIGCSRRVLGVTDRNRCRWPAAGGDHTGRRRYRPGGYQRLLQTSDESSPTLVLHKSEATQKRWDKT